MQNNALRPLPQGFNRAFQKVSAYGKGVYFARDASYSCSERYSPPDGKGIQRMFVSRVTVGDWSLRNDGNGGLTPLTKPGALSHGRRSFRRRLVYLVRDSPYKIY